MQTLVQLVVIFQIFFLGMVHPGTTLDLLSKCWYWINRKYWAITGPQKKLHVRDDGDSYPLLVQNRTNAVSTCGVALIATGSDFSDGQYATIEALSGGTGSYTT